LKGYPFKHFDSVFTKIGFFLFFWFGGFGARKNPPPPTLGVSLYSDDWSFPTVKKPQIPHLPYARIGDAALFFACIQPTYSSFDPRNWHP